MAAEVLAHQLQDLNLADAADAGYLPFRPTGDLAGTLGSLDDVPRYLFRVFTPRSQGFTDNNWAKSEDAKRAAEDCEKDLFARDDRHGVAHMIDRHLRWGSESRSDNLVSWTSSLLVALVYIFHRRANTRDRSTFDHIRLCVVDTICFPRGVFIRDMDLIQAYRPFDSQLKDFEDLRSKKRSYLGGHFYYGEYLSQGALRIEGKCEIVSARAIIDQNLYGLLPEFEEFSLWEPGPGPPWAIPVIGMREEFYAPVDERRGISEDGVQAAINIGELFGQRWRLPVAIHLVALVPHRSDDTNVLRAFRRGAFTGFVAKAQAPLGRAIAFESNVQEHLEADGPTPPDQEMALVETNHNILLGELDSIRRLAESLHASLTNKAEGTS